MHLTIQSSTRLQMLMMPMMCLMAMLSGCATNQLHPTTQVLAINLEPQVLKATGIAFINYADFCNRTGGGQASSGARVY